MTEPPRFTNLSRRQRKMGQPPPPTTREQIVIILVFVAFVLIGTAVTITILVP